MGLARNKGGMVISREYSSVFSSDNSNRLQLKLTIDDTFKNLCRAVKRAASDRSDSADSSSVKRASYSPDVGSFGLSPDTPESACSGFYSDRLEDDPFEEKASPVVKQEMSFIPDLEMNNNDVYVKDEQVLFDAVFSASTSSSSSCFTSSSSFIANNNNNVINNNNIYMPKTIFNPASNASISSSSSSDSYMSSLTVGAYPSDLDSIELDQTDGLLDAASSIVSHLTGIGHGPVVRPQRIMG